VGVLAHSAKTLGGGLEELRKTLATYGINDPMWHEVPKSRFVPEQVKKLLKEDVELIFVWGGDGTVQRVIDAVAGVPVALAILPAGTANLFATNLGKSSVKMRIDVDGKAWFKGKVSCLLIGNVGDVIGGISAFPDAQPDDGLLNLGVVTASGAMDWVRTLGRSVIGDAQGSPFVETTTGRTFDIRLNKAVPYEIDGGVRKKTKHLKVKVDPGAITVCVPREEAP